DRLGDRQPKDRNHMGVADLPHVPDPKRRQYLRERLAIAQYRHVGRRLESLGALPDGRDQHLLFVADQRVELSLRYTRARRDLEGTGRRVATLAEGAEWGGQDALTHRRTVPAFFCS